MDKTLKIIAAVLAVVVIASMAFVFSGTPAPEDDRFTATDTIYFFYGDGCTHCHEVMPFVTNLSTRYPQADIRIVEVWNNRTNNQLFLQVTTDAGVTGYGVPKVVLGTVVLSGKYEIPEKMEALVQDYLKKKP